MKTKKVYEAPQMEIMEMEVEQVLASSAEDFNEKPGSFGVREVNENGNAFSSNGF